MDIHSVSNFLTQVDMGLQKEASSRVSRDRPVVTITVPLQALNYFESLKNDPSGWKLCINALLNQQQDLNEPRVFFCLLVIENYVKTK